MNIFKEFYISLVKPQEYYSLKKLSIIRVLLYQFALTIIGLISSLFLELIGQMFLGSFKDFINLFKLTSPLIMSAKIIQMWGGIILSTVLLSGIFYGINFIRGIKSYSFLDIYKYMAHAFTVAAIVSAFMGPLITFVVIALYILATKADKEREGQGSIGSKYTQGIK